MSALGQKQTFAVQKGMSALPPKADIGCEAQNVRYGPRADSCSATNLVNSAGECAIAWLRGAFNPHIDFVPKHHEIDRFGQ
jgi:hypothetical protein